MISNIISESKNLLPLKVNRAIFNKWVGKKTEMSMRLYDPKSLEILLTYCINFQLKALEAISHLNKVETGCLKMFKAMNTHYPLHSQHRDALTV